MRNSCNSGNRWHVGVLHLRQQSYQVLHIFGQYCYLYESVILLFTQELQSLSCLLRIAEAINLFRRSSSHVHLMDFSSRINFTYYHQIRF